MNPKFLLDTNICIYIRRRRPPEILQRFLRLQVGEAAISVITFGELIYGAEKSEQRKAAMRQLEELASLLPVLPLPVDTGRSYGALRANWKPTVGSSGTTICGSLRMPRLPT
jgi:tRNA(fMet)-specific endonuclease VapC